MGWLLYCNCYLSLLLMKNSSLVHVKILYVIVSKIDMISNEKGDPLFI